LLDQRLRRRPPRSQLRAEQPGDQNFAEYGQLEPVVGQLVIAVLDQA